MLPYSSSPASSSSISIIRILAIPYALTFIVMLYYTRTARLGRLQKDLDVLRARKKTLDRLAGIPQEQISYFDNLVQINVDNLRAYYSLVRDQTDKSFMASIAAGGIGFLLILTGLAIGLTGITNAPSISYIASGSGIITEFISGIFFYLYSKAVLQMKGYHDSLVIVQNILLSFKIVGDLQNETERVKMIGQMIGYLVSKQPSSNDISLVDTSNKSK